MVPVTLPVEPLLPDALVAESSRLNENLFGLRLKFATLSLTYCCNELKKLIVDTRGKKISLALESKRNTGA